MKKIIFVFIAALFAVTGCKSPAGGSDGDGDGSEYSDFIANTHLEGVFISNTPFLQVDEDLHQIAVNVNRKSYRLQSDNQSMSCMMVQNADFSQLNAKGSLTVTARGVYTLESSAYEVEVVQIKDGKIWLWHSPLKIGFVVPKF